MTTIVWFRRDLRLADNPALRHAAAHGPVVAAFIVDETDPRPPGGASRWWLHHSLAALERSLGAMVYLSGDPLTELCKLVGETGADAVFWNRCYEPHAIKRDKAIKAALADAGIAARSFNAGLLAEPWELATGAGEPYKVFTPFWRALSARGYEKPLGRARPGGAAPAGIGTRLDALDLLPSGPNWAAGWNRIWTPGEAGAAARLDRFVADGLAGYATLRDRPDLAHVSRLSPHLHFGEISPRQVFARVDWAAGEDAALSPDVEKFRSEIGWREFSHHLLYHYSDLPAANWKDTFDAFPWRESAADLAAWQRGMTGYPLVDAGMRELWRTGTMHNRARMVAASFLTKHLRIDWRHGQAWFWDTLVDADLANNAAGWQWVAGSGADAAPYFRIFNPTTQARRFDPDGAYIRRWCPELATLPDADIHAPFEADNGMLAQAGIRLGETYPEPIVDHGEARAAALAAYGTIGAGRG
ncbi:MAG: deoxyribodipyrimidine photo-lyase [Rhizobiaceae bacterium]